MRTRNTAVRTAVVCRLSVSCCCIWFEHGPHKPIRCVDASARLAWCAPDAFRIDATRDVSGWRRSTAHQQRLEHAAVANCNCNSTPPTHHSCSTYAQTCSGSMCGHVERMTSLELTLQRSKNRRFCIFAYTAQPRCRVTVRRNEQRFTQHTVYYESKVLYTGIHMRNICSLGQI